MKTNHLVSAVFAALITAAFASAAPLTETTAVHTKPDASSPAISYLKAGTEPVAAEGSVASTPAGWMAVELPGPVQGYVLSKDLSKGLDVKPGTPVRTAPEANAPVIMTAERGDKSTITGLHGRWTQVSFDKKAIGYINVGSAPGYLPPIATAPAGSALSAATTPMPVAPAPEAYASNGPGQPVATSTNPNDSSSVLPRQVAGWFVSTRSVFHPRRPFDWALNDNSGKRYAYLDISKLLLTEQIEKYVGHAVVVFGAAKPTADGKDIVIQVESLQMRP